MGAVRAIDARLRLVAALSLTGLVAACGSAHEAAPTVQTYAAPPARHHADPAGKVITLAVTVLDGDRGTRVPGAKVRVSKRVVRAGRTGIARIRAQRRTFLAVTVSARGYATRTVVERLAGARAATVRVYRPSLQWPMYGVTPTRTQAQADIRLRPPFRVVWSVDLGGLLEFPAVVTDGVAYIGNTAASVRAISMRFGTVLWRHDTPSGGMGSSPAVDGGTLVYHTMDGHVFGLDRANGRARWSYDVRSPIESSPVVDDGVDYFGAWNGRVYALDTRAKKLLWSRDLGAKITSSAAISGETLYIGDYAGRLWALSLRSGATRWIGWVNGRIYGTPAVSDGRVFVPSSSGDSLTAFSTSGRELWRVGTGGYVYSSPAVWRGVVCFGSYDGYLYGVSAASGRVLWRAWVGGPVSGAAVVVDGIAYAGSFAHRIVGVDVATGQQVLTFAHGEYVPVSGNGMRLLFHGYSRLYAMEPRSPESKQPTRAVTHTEATRSRPLRRGHR